MVGLVGLSDEHFLDALYRCVGMYLMSYGDTPPNLLVEIARWTAPLVTASWVVLAVGTLRRVLGSRVRYLRDDSGRCTAQARPSPFCWSNWAAAA